VSRLPRALEYLKTGFNAEAASAARCRAAAARATSDRRPKLAEAWLALASEKDALAIRQLEATGQLHGGEHDLAAAIAEEHYENESLYPRMQREVDPETAAVFQAVIAQQVEHLARLEKLFEEVTTTTGDLAAAG
jgi:rubrerythrin